MAMSAPPALRPDGIKPEGGLNFLYVATPKVADSSGRVVTTGGVSCVG